MKKVISILIAVIIAVLPLGAGFSAFAKGSDSNNSINEFVNGIVELTHEYDANKEFSVKEDVNSVQTYSSENNGEEYTLQDFQTARLIVRANKKFDDFAALKHVSGFEDFHILQYESPENAKSAYEYLKTEKNIIEIAPDSVCCLNKFQNDPENPRLVSKDEFVNDWSKDRTQVKRLKDYFSQSNVSMKEILVGIIDTGIDYNHEIYKGRLKRTYFNASTSGKENDEMDSQVFYHGTTVSSVVVNNTPENIRIAMYKVADAETDATVTSICSGLLKAIEDGCGILNISIVGVSDILLKECIAKAYNENIPVFSPVGNDGIIDEANYPANFSDSIAVSATDINNTTTLMNTWTHNSDVSAPGEDIAVAIPDNRYAVFSGTSFSAPYAAALGAILKSNTSNITVDEIKNRLKETSLNVKRCNIDVLTNSNAYMDNYCSLYDGVGMIQFCNAFGLEKLTAPEINLEDKVYVGEQTCSITCTDNDATVLYTTDGTYPAVDNAKVYTKPFKITKRTRIRAVAYYKNGGYYSDEAEATPRIQYIDSDENFVIDKNGVISLYKGNITNLYVPDVVKGITVTGFDKGAFANVTELALPESVTEITTGAFSKNANIRFVYGNGVRTVKSSSFSNSGIMCVEFPNAKTIEKNAFFLSEKLYYAHCPKLEKISNDAFYGSGIVAFEGDCVEIIDDGAFANCSRLESICFPKCITQKQLWGAIGVFENCSALVDVKLPLITDLNSRAFSNTNICEASFPFVTIIGSGAFYNCTNLSYINLPSLIIVSKSAFLTNFYCSPRTFYLESVTEIEQNAFGKSNTIRAEFSHLETAQSLPQTEKCIISLPSTFKKCTEDTKGRNYTVYGTKGTYAEQWANENGHTFVEISQDTAVLTQLPEKYTDADGVLTADVIGFNRTYQWYASSENNNTAGTPIPGATGKEFNPADYPAKYYYCVVISTDVGYDSIEIRTGVCENTTFVSADYSEYDKVVAQAKALDRSLYTDLTELDEALLVDISGLSNAQQNIVDEQTAKIKAALDNLVLEPADYSRVNEQINTVPEHLEYYTDETVSALNEILSGIDYGLDITKQEVVDSYAEQLQNAISALEYKPADYTEYDKAVAKANGLDKEKYVDFSQVEKELAVDVGGRNITQQEEVDLQTKAILAAIAALEEKPQEPPIINPEQDKTNGGTTPDKPNKNGSMLSPMTGSETYTGVFTALAVLSFATVLLVRKKKDK